MAWYGRLNGGDATAAVGFSWRRHFGIPLNRLIAVVCAAAVAILWLTTLQRIDFERQQAVDAAQQSNANLAIAFEQQVFRTLKAAEQVAAFVRERYAHHGAAINLPQWVNERVIRDAMFNIVSVVDADGEIVSSSVNTGRITYADREFFLAQKNNQADTLYVNPPAIGRVTGRWQVPMSLRISEPDGRFGGVVVMSVDPGSFTHFYRQADLGGQGLLELTGLDGIVRARVVGSEGSFGADAAGLPWYRRHVDEAVGSLIDDGAAVDGVARLVSYRTMADYPLMVTVGTAYAAELAPAMQRRSTYLASASLGTAMLLVGAGLLMFVLARQRAVAEAQRASEALFRATFHQAAMGIALIAPDGIIRRVNDKFSRMLGYDTDALCGRSLFDLVVEDSRAAARQFLHHRLSVYSPVYSPEIEKPYRRSDGTILWVCEALGVVKTADGRPDFLVAVAQDITARKDLEARLSHDALHDALTGLPNRVMSATG